MSAKRNFLTRVNVERDLLRLVNESGKFEEPLHGTTVGAVKNWVARGSETEAGANYVYLGPLLLEVSERLRVNADKSRDVFETGELVGANTVQASLDALRVRIQAISAD